MTTEQKLKVLRSMTDESDEDILLSYLDIAKQKVLAKLYPFDPERNDIPERYAMTVIEIAAYLLNKRGAEGETEHSENGIQRVYESASVPDSMLRHVIPYVKVLGGDVE